MALTLLFVVYCLEAGVFFIVAPWTRFWVNHPLLHLSPIVAFLADNAFFRGLISGFGVAHVIVAIHEVQQVFFRRRRS
jgi:hypothetical protein